MAATAAALKLHVFNCAPTPKVIAVDLKAEVREHTLADYPGELEKVDVKPNFGFWTVVVEPFIPKLGVWFDPSQGMLLVGAQLQRYYKGPRDNPRPETRRGDFQRRRNARRSGAALMAALKAHSENLVILRAQTIALARV